MPRIVHCQPQIFTRAMKKIFILLLAILIAASIYTYLTGASKRTDVPVISWKSDANPQRYEQIDMYHKFLQKNGVVKEDGSPRGQLVLDTASNQSTLIQAVSGMAGDIFDEDLGPVIRNNLGDLLKNLRAKEGVFAILGNHEFYGHSGDATRYLEDHHIRVLRDSAVTLPSGVVIAGREDITGERMFREKRKSLQDLLAGSDATRPVIVMDHQPYHLSEVAKNPVDLQVSGHTHHGQLWPFNFITRAIFEISAGYGKIGNTHFYVSPGVGTWGPPIRTSSRPEVIVLEITGPEGRRSEY